MFVQSCYAKQESTICNGALIKQFEAEIRQFVSVIYLLRCLDVR